MFFLFVEFGAVSTFSTSAEMEVDVDVDVFVELSFKESRRTESTTRDQRHLRLWCLRAWRLDGVLLARFEHRLHQRLTLCGTTDTCAAGTLPSFSIRMCGTVAEHQNSAASQRQRLHRVSSAACCRGRGIGCWQAVTVHLSWHSCHSSLLDGSVWTPGDGLGMTWMEGPNMTQRHSFLF